jgi:hypothetical protein
MPKRPSQLKMRMKKNMMMITMKRNLRNFLTKMMRKNIVISKKMRRNPQQKLKMQKSQMIKKVVSLDKKGKRMMNI